MASWCILLLKTNKLLINLNPEQARRQDVAAVGAKNQREGPKTRRGAHFLNTVLDVCSNRWAKREMGGAPISNGGAGHHWPPRWRRP